MPDPSFRNLPISRTRFHTRLSPMTYFPPSQTSRRAPRTWFAETTPAVLRCLDGHRVRGKLQVISLTGGLLWLSKPLGQGCQVKLMFLTRTGSVLGVAEMSNFTMTTRSGCKRRFNRRSTGPVAARGKWEISGRDISRLKSTETGDSELQVPIRVLPAEPSASSRL
jgi:hypothetical protein